MSSCSSTPLGRRCSRCYTMSTTLHIPHCPGRFPCLSLGPAFTVQPQMSGTKSSFYSSGLTEPSGMPSKDWSRGSRDSDVYAYSQPPSGRCMDSRLWLETEGSWCVYGTWKHSRKRTQITCAVFAGFSGTSPTPKPLILLYVLQVLFNGLMATLTLTHCLTQLSLSLKNVLTQPSSCALA